MRPPSTLPATPPVFPLFRMARALVNPHHAHQRQTRCASSGAAVAEAPPTAAAAEAAPPAQQLLPASWPGLHAWRAAGRDVRTVWGAKGPIPATAATAAELGPGAAAVAASERAADAAPLPASLAECARAVLLTQDPLGKAALTHRAWRAWCDGQLPLGTAEALQGLPARPAKPELVPPRQIPSMDKSPLPKTVYMLHNLAHVELNAIDLAWDTVLRFSACGLPEAFYADFARVADDESRHLSWCLQRLEELGYGYGCMPAHNLLWEGAEASAGDLGARLAIVPMSQEARGLDAGDRLAKRLVGMGDNRTAAIVRRIALEERAHVAVGVTWFSAICQALGTEPGAAFRRLLLDYCPGLLKGPFNDGERALVGLQPELYDVRLWPEAEAEAAAAAVAAAAAAEREGRPHTVAASAAGAAAAMLPLADERQMRQLAARLGALLGLEAGSAGMI
ncbi:hypothetical protein ABPG77_003947 [Micractinium sp. CCAP 211/92]